MRGDRATAIGALPSGRLVHLETLLTVWITDAGRRRVSLLALPERAL
jgi:hypothetical protein